MISESVRGEVSRPQKWYGMNHFTAYRARKLLEILLKYLPLLAQLYLRITEQRSIFPQIFDVPNQAQTEYQW